MRIPFLVAVAGLAGVALANQQESLRDQLIAEIQADASTDDHTCRRVQEMGKGTVADAACRSQLEAVNASCREVAREHTPSTPTESEAKDLVGILMLCPVAKILDLPFSIHNGKIGVRWSDLPK